MRNKKIGVISLGCDKNRVDSESMMATLKTAGYSFTSDYREADLVIVNTCAFINSARKEAIDTIFEAARKKLSHAKLVVTGCLPQKYEKELKEELPEVDAFLGINYENVLQVIDKLFDDCNGGASFDSDYNALNESDLSDASLLGNGGAPFDVDADKMRVTTTPPHYAYVKIADGCDNRCTYCTIPSIRGKYVSRKIEDIVNEARLLASRGVKELILVAQDLTYYGTDLYGEARLVELLRELKGIAFLRLLYCYPERITKRLIEEIRDNESVIKYIDIPLQHCNPRVLRRMGRGYDKDALCVLLDNLREIPSIALRTTFIIGFPGESEQEFIELTEFVRAQEFFNVGFFIYSPEEDTPSFKLKDHIPLQTAEERLQKIAAVQKEVAMRCNARLVGTVLRVIIDKLTLRGGVGRAYCHAPEVDGIVRIISKAPLRAGEYYDVKITGVKGYDLLGII